MTPKFLNCMTEFMITSLQQEKKKKDKIFGGKIHLIWDVLRL